MKSLDARTFLMGAYYALLVKDLELSRDYVTLEKRVGCEGISFLTKTLPSLGKIFDRALGDGEFSSSVLPFKRARNCAYPRFLGSLFHRVFENDGRLRNNVCIRSVSQIRQICFLAYKVDIPFSDEQELSVLERFEENERELSSLDESFFSTDVVKLASVVTTEIFRGKRLENIVPSNGPGLTSNVRSIDKTEYQLHPGSPVYSHYGKLFWFNSEDAFSRLERYPIWDHFSYFNDQGLRAKIILVPKDSRGPRLISCEPAEHMYIQQGIMRKLTSWLEEEIPLTRGSIFFRNNETHRNLALEASLTQEWSTLDLKDASDRVHLDLVRALFSGTALIGPMLCCRTRRTESSDKVYDLAKWAPMGSALCFPVLAFVVFILAYCQLIREGVSPDTAKDSIKVFGDDIIVRTEYAKSVIRVLEAHGLLVNHSKSFINSRFAESCGCDAFDGVDVTPHRLRKVWKINDEIQTKRPGSVAYHLCALANQVTLSYTNLREYIFASVERILDEPLPYGLDLSYLCRVCSEKELTFLMSEYLDRMEIPRHKRKFSAWKVKTKRRRFRESPYGRLSRTINMMGQEFVLPKYGETVLPRDSSIVRRLTNLSCQRL